jgi:uncharacterized protein
MAAITQKYPAQIVYFEREGRENLAEVLRVIKKTMRKRSEVRDLKIVIFTAEGQGPAMAYNSLGQYDPKMIAVPFPLDFAVKTKDGQQFFPRISSKVKRFFDGVGIAVLPPARLPFDPIDGMDLHNQQMKLVKDTLSLFGGGLTMCVQATLRACDAGEVEPGERVIAMAGDCALIITASTTAKFLTGQGLSVNEILCKARNLTIARVKNVAIPQPAQQVLPGAAPRSDLKAVKAIEARKALSEPR